MRESEAVVKDLPRDLSRKADRILSRYGGLKGLSQEPAWLVTYVLKTFFPETERKQILQFLMTNSRETIAG